MANSVDPDQTAPIGAVCSGYTLFASILNVSVMLGNYLQQTTSADNIFRCIFFLGALRVNSLAFSSSSDSGKFSNTDLSDLSIVGTCVTVTYLFTKCVTKSCDSPDWLIQFTELVINQRHHVSLKPLLCTLFGSSKQPENSTYI